MFSHDQVNNTNCRQKWGLYNTAAPRTFFFNTFSSFCRCGLRNISDTFSAGGRWCGAVSICTWRFCLVCSVACMVCAVVFLTFLLNVSVFLHSLLRNAFHIHTVKRCAHLGALNLFFTGRTHLLGHWQTRLVCCAFHEALHTHTSRIVLARRVGNSCAAFSYVTGTTEHWNFCKGWITVGQPEQHQTKETSSINVGHGFCHEQCLERNWDMYASVSDVEARIFRQYTLLLCVNSCS